MLTSLLLGLGCQSQRPEWFDVPFTIVGVEVNTHDFVSEMVSTRPELYESVGESRVGVLLSNLQIVSDVHAERSGRPSGAPLVLDLEPCTTGSTVTYIDGALDVFRCIAIDAVRVRTEAHLVLEEVDDGQVSLFGELMQDTDFADSTVGSDSRIRGVYEDVLVVDGACPDSYGDGHIDSGQLTIAYTGPAVPGDITVSFAGCEPREIR